MEVQVSGHNMEVGESLHTRVSNRLKSLASKRVQQPIAAQVIFDKSPQNSIECKIHSHLMKDATFHSVGSGREAADAFEDAVDKMDKQWRRHMRKMKNKPREKVVEGLVTED